jgi:hypothetical protein
MVHFSLVGYMKKLARIPIAYFKRKIQNSLPIAYNVESGGNAFDVMT